MKSSDQEVTIHKKLKGSVTVEAAMSLTLFIMAFYSILYIFVVINFWYEMGVNVDRNTYMISGYSYIVSKVNNTETDDKVINKLKETFNEDTLNNIMDITFLYNNIVVKKKDLIETVDVDNGIYGMSLLKSSLNQNDDDINTIRLDYSISMPFLNKVQIRLSNKSYFRSFTGRTMVGEELYDNPDEKTVYITENGEVYHMSKRCRVLNIKLIEVNKEDVCNFRNSSGGKYYPCEYCGKKCKGKVFISLYGDRYHADKNCPKIKRNIKSVKLKDVKDRDKCKICGGYDE